MLSGQPSDVRHEDYLLELARALYKLHFQLLLLIEATNKMIATLTVALKSAQVCFIRHTHNNTYLIISITV